MNKSQKSIRLGSGKKALYIILIALPIIILLQMCITASLSIKAVNQNALQQLNDQIRHAGMSGAAILWNRRLAPAKKLSSLEFPRDNMEAAALALEFHEITEINQFADGGFKTIFTAAPSAKIHDGIAKTALAMKDTISFINAYWDTTYTQYEALVEIEESKYTFTFVKKGEDLRLIALDPDKLKPQLPEIFACAERQSPFSAKYFHPAERFTSQIKLYDESGANFFTYGDPKGRGWDDIWDMDLPILPWRMTVQIFLREEIKLLDSASVAGKIPWFPIVEFIIAVVCIILAVHFSPELRGFSKTDNP